MIFPNLKYFSVGHGKTDEPHRAYFLTYFIAVSFTAIGKAKRKGNRVNNETRRNFRRIERHRTDHLEFLSDDVRLGELFLFRRLASESQWMATGFSLLQ